MSDDVVPEVTKEATAVSTDTVKAATVVATDVKADVIDAFESVKDGITGETKSAGFKKYGYAVLIGLALVAGGYATGRYAAPDKVVVTKELVTVHDQVVVKVVDQDAILKAISNLNVQKDVHKVKTIVVAKDGTKTETVTTDDKSKTEEQTQVATQVVTHAVDTAHTTDTTHLTLTKTTERARPSWRLSLMPGLDLAEVLGHNQGTPFSLLPSSDAMLKYVVVGVGLEHRLLGPVSGGVWANTRGAGGLILTLEW